MCILNSNRKIPRKYLKQCAWIAIFFQKALFNKNKKAMALNQIKLQLFAHAILS